LSDAQLHAGSQPLTGRRCSQASIVAKIQAEQSLIGRMQVQGPLFDAAEYYLGTGVISNPRKGLLEPDLPTTVRSGQCDDESLVAPEFHKGASPL